MPRILWIIGVVVTFGVGLAAGVNWPRPTSQESRAQHPLVADLQRQIAILKADMQRREAELAVLRSRVQAQAGPDTTSRVAVLASTAVVPQSSPPPPPSATSVETPTEAPTDARAADDPTPTPSEARALASFHQYLEDTEGPGRSEWRQRARALVAELREMGEPAVTALLQALENGIDSRERQAAARLLGALQDLRALPALQTVLEQEDDITMRRAAARGLRLLQAPEAIPVLETLLANPQDDRFVRMSAAYGLAQLGDQRGVPGLVTIFDEAEVDGRGRSLAFQALTHLNDTAALPFMRHLVTSQEEVSYRLRAIRFLTDHGDREALPLLQELAASSEEQASIRDAAGQAYVTISSRGTP